MDFSELFGGWLGGQLMKNKQFYHRVGFAASGIAEACHVHGRARHSRLQHELQAIRWNRS
jgi:hypothetical protein